MNVSQVLGKDWAGGPLVQLHDTISRPSADDLTLNHCWVRPFVEQFRDRVPSGFFIADVFVMLDKLWMGRLLIPLEQGDSKTNLATEESKKIKLLIGALRALWRSSFLARFNMFYIWCLMFLVGYSASCIDQIDMG